MLSGQDGYHILYGEICIEAKKEKAAEKSVLRGRKALTFKEWDAMIVELQHAPGGVRPF